MPFSKEMNLINANEKSHEDYQYESKTADYIDIIFDRFIELQGDRKSGDDSNVLCGLSQLDDHKVVVIGYRWVKSARKIILAGAEGYRKALRLMRMAESFGKPVVILIDIPEAFDLSTPYLQKASEAIARSLEDAVYLMTPVIAIIVGKSNSVSALDLCMADRILMLENASISVHKLNKSSDIDNISDSIQYLKPQDLLDLNIIHRIVKDPLKDKTGATTSALREVIIEELQRLSNTCPQALVKQRLDRFEKQFLAFKSSSFFSNNIDNVN